MSERLRRALQLALAALIASAGGGLVLVLLFAVVGSGAALLDGSSADATVSGFIIFVLMLASLSVVPAISAAWLPVFVAGAVLWTAGRRHGWAHGRGAWAVAGSLVGASVWLRAFTPGADDPPFNGFGLPEAVLAATFLLAGAAGGLTFRSAMTATAPFFGFDEEDEA